MTALYFIIALGLLVAIHEWGHFIVAKLIGAVVETFSIGFGPKLIGFKKGETDYRIAAIPLGGYVKIVGEDPSDESIALYPPERAFGRKPLLSRAAVILAGPVMNLVLALFLLILVFSIGRKEPKILGDRPIVTAILPHSPAEKSGFAVGDEIIAVNGQAISNWTELLDRTSLDAGKTVAISLSRSGATLDKTVLLENDPFTKAPIGFLGVEPQYVVNNEPVLGAVVPLTPAAEAQLQVGDRVLSIDGASIRFWHEVVELVTASSGKPLTLKIERGKEIIEKSITPVQEGKVFRLGIGKKDLPFETVLHRYPLGEAISKGVSEFKKLTDMTLEVVKRLFTAELSYKSLGGPIQIAAASGAAARGGTSDFLYFMAFLSLQLGILNLLPIPALDGGHLAFMLIETVIRRPIPPKVKGAILYAGFALLLSLMLLVTLHDMESVWGLDFKKIPTLIRGLF